MLQYFVPVPAILRRNGDAHGCRNDQMMIGNVEGLPEIGQDILGDIRRTLTAGLAAQYDELIAAEAGYCSPAPQRIADIFCDRRWQLNANDVTKGIVDLLEPGKVHPDARHFPSLPFHFAYNCTNNHLI